MIKTMISIYIAHIKNNVHKNNIWNEIRGNKIEWNKILSSILVQWEWEWEWGLIIKESICKFIKKLRGYSQKRKTPFRRNFRSRPQWKLPAWQFPVQPATNTPPKRQQFRLSDVLDLLNTGNNVVIVTIFAQSIEARYLVENEDVVGAAPNNLQLYCLIMWGLYQRFDGMCISIQTGNAAHHKNVHARFALCRVLLRLVFDQSYKNRPKTNSLALTQSYDCPMYRKATAQNTWIH